MTPNARKVFDYLIANVKNNDLTAQEVAATVGVSIQTVTGHFNSLVKKGYGFREVVETVDDKDKTVETKYLRLNEEAYSFDPEAKVAKKA